MVPVGRLAKYQGLVVDEPLTHLGNAEHRTVLVHHPGIHRGVDVEPFLQLLRPHRINHMALVVERIGRHTGDIAGWDTHRQIHLAERDSQLSAVDAFACSLTIVIQVDSIHLGKSPVATVVAHIVVSKV